MHLSSEASKGNEIGAGRTGSPRTTALILAGIVALAVVSSYAVYAYSGNVSASIQSSSAATIRANDRSQSEEIANVLSANLNSVIANLVFISDSPSLSRQNVTAATELLRIAQNTTGILTRSYAWIDQKGNLVANSNTTIFQSFKENHLNASSRSYFVDARDSGTLYVSNAFATSTPANATVLVISFPLFGGNHTFRGVVVSTITLSALGALMGSDAATHYPGSVTVVDRNGTMMYGPPLILGKSVVDPSLLAYFTPAVRNASIQFWKSELEAIHPASINSSVAGLSTFSVYTPLNVTVPSSQSGLNKSAPVKETVGLVGLGTLVALPASQAAQIAQLQQFSTLTIGGIGSGATVGAFVVLRWNRRLGDLVIERTKELAESNEELARKSSQLDEANKELVARDETQRDFVNIAVHELRTPVQPLLIIGEILKEMSREGKVELSQADVNMIERNTKRLDRLTRTVLDVTRADSGTLKLNKEKFDLNDEVKAAIAEVGGTARQTEGSAESGLLRARSETRGRNEPANAVGSIQGPSTLGLGDAPSPFLFSPAAEPLPVDADRTRIFEVLANILRNAKNFSLGREIEVSTSKEGTDAILTVRDYGTGIDPQILPRMFTKFASRSATGIGLGLYISKKIVEAHGGEISAENCGDGRGGATVRVTIPLSPVAEVPLVNETTSEKRA